MKKCFLLEGSAFLATEREMVENKAGEWRNQGNCAIMQSKQSKRDQNPSEDL